MVGEDNPGVPEAARRLRHLSDGRAAVRPLRMDVAVATQRGGQLRGPLRHRAAARRLQATQVDRLLAPNRLGHRALEHLADPCELVQGALLRASAELVGRKVGYRLGRSAKGPYPV